MSGAKFRPGTLAIAVPRSDNGKLGDAATTYAAQGSCPRSCVFFDGGGCYAETGAVGKFVTTPLNEAAGHANSIAIAKAEARAIDSLSVPEGRPLRLHTVGDCATEEAACIVSAAAERYMARGGGAVWTYTHGWREVDRSSWGKVSVLASCETAEDIAAAQARGYATALVVEEFRSERRYGHSTAIDQGAVDDPGRPTSSRVAPEIVPCPSQTRHVPCSDCGLCFNDSALLERGYSIGFELHGIPYAVRQARRALRDPDSPTRKLTAEEELRVLLASEPHIGPTEAAARLDMNPGYAGQLLAFIRGQAPHPSVLRSQRYERTKRARQAERIADALLDEVRS